MSLGYFERVQAQTPTKFWINNVTRSQAQIAIDHGACGCTQNPAYTWKMMNSEEEKPYVMEKLQEIMAREKDDNQALICLQKELIGGVAKVFKQVFDATHGKHGYVSIQGDPFMEDEKSILEFAKFHREAGENIMCKIPAVPGGIAAIEKLIKMNVPINATECMAIQQVIDVCELYEKTTKNMVNPAPMYFSLITGIFDEHLQNVVKRDNIDISKDVLWQGGLAIAKKVYEITTQRGYKCQFIGGGARGLHHFTEMVGGDVSITINWGGTADLLLEQDPPVVSRLFNPTPFEVVDELTAKLDDFRRAYYLNAITPEEYEDYGPVVLFRSSFEKAWKQARELIASLR